MVLLQFKLSQQGVVVLSTLCFVPRQYVMFHSGDRYNGYLEA